MNPESKQFLENKEVLDLLEKLAATHKPIKAELKPKRLEALGLTLVKFQRLEFTVRRLIGAISGFSGNPRILDIVTVKNSFSSLLAVLRALSIEVEFSQHDDLNLLIAHCYRVEQVRNQLIHSVWTSGPRMKTDIKSKMGLKHKFEDYSVDDLNQIASQIDLLDTAMEAIMFNCICGDSPLGE